MIRIGIVAVSVLASILLFDRLRIYDLVIDGMVDNCQLIETDDSNHNIHGTHTQIYLDAINSFLKEDK